MRPDDLSERLMDFAARIGRVVDALPDTRMGRHIAGQLVRCGTSPAPNYEEARAAESRADFIHKLGICLKELRESRCWIRLGIKTELLPQPLTNDLLNETNELCNIIEGLLLLRKRIERQRGDSSICNCNFQFAIPDLMRLMRTQ